MALYGGYIIKRFCERRLVMENTTPTPIISASDVTAIGTELKNNISAIAPALLGVMAITMVVAVIFKLVKRFGGK